LKDYIRIEDGHRVVLARNDAAEPITAALLSGTACQPVQSQGRGHLLRFPLPDGAGLIRPFRRGGVVRHAMKNNYLLHNRPLREFFIHRHLQHERLPVAPLLGVCWLRRGPCFQGAIATEELQALNLHGHLQENPDDFDMLTACGALIRRMHDAGLWHADLQIKNILIADSGPLLIDFDNAKMLPRLNAKVRAGNLFRLRRSFEKNGHPGACYDALCMGYGPLDAPRWMNHAFRFKGRVSDHISGRKPL
jgi:3-deoxy-D-manno-octulosonic acid kinase